jgi:hypothetical protein
MPMIELPDADTPIDIPQVMVPQMMECQRADNDMHDNHSQAAAMRRTNVLQPARQLAAINSRRLVVATHSHLSDKLCDVRVLPSFDRCCNEATDIIFPKL